MTEKECHCQKGTWRWEKFPMLVCSACGGIYLLSAMSTTHRRVLQAINEPLWILLRRCFEDIHTENPATTVEEDVDTPVRAEVQTPVQDMVFGAVSEAVTVRN